MFSGTVTIFQYGAGPNGVMRTLGKYMLGSGATFGYVSLIFLPSRILIYPQSHSYASGDYGLMLTTSSSLFMSIGSVIRTEGPHNDAWLRARGPPMMLPRQSPLGPVRE